MEQTQLLTLIEQSRAGDPQAQETLVLVTQDRVYYHCKKMLRNEQDALDATQDVLITMITNLDKLKAPAAYWGWVNGITANRCKHLLTQGTKEWQIPEDEEGNSMLDALETLDEQAVPHEVLDNDETRRLMLDIIDALPPEQRMTVLFYYYDEMPVKDIAAAMEVSEGTVKSRLNYARRSIKTGVEDLERKGTKLYGLSPLPLLLLFLRREAAQSGLTAAQSGRITAALSAAKAGGAAAASAGAAAGATSGAAGSVAAAAGVATKTGVGLGAKIVIGLVAAALIGGAAVGGATIAKHVSESRAQEVWEEDREEDRTPESTTEPDPMTELAPAYIAKVEELVALHGEGCCCELIYFDEDDIPELIATYDQDSYYATSVTGLFVYADGMFYDAGESYSGIRYGDTYYSGKNIMETHYADAMANAEAASMGVIYSRLGADHTLEQFYRRVERLDENYEWYVSEEEPQGGEPTVEGLEGLQLVTTQPASQLLQQLSQYAASKPEEESETRMARTR